MVLVVKNPPANPGDIRDAGPTPGSRRSSEGGDDNSFQYSCLQYYNTTILQFLPTESHGQRSLAGYSPQSQGVRQD